MHVMRKIMRKRRVLTVMQHGHQPYRHTQARAAQPQQQHT